MKTRKIRVWKAKKKPWMSLSLEGKRAGKPISKTRRLGKPGVKFKLVATYEVPKVFAADIIKQVYESLADYNVRCGKETHVYLVGQRDVEQAIELSKVAVMGDFGYIENYKRELVETLFSKVYVIYGVDEGDYLFHEGVYTNLDKARATAKARVLELTDNPADADSSSLMREGYEYWRTSGDAVVILEEVGFEFHKKGR
jgi:hypothetical protein